MLGLAAAARGRNGRCADRRDHHQFGRCPQALMPGACRQHHHVAAGDVEVAAACAAEAQLGAGARCRASRGPSSDSGRRDRCRCATCRPSRCGRRLPRQRLQDWPCRTGRSRRGGGGPAAAGCWGSSRRRQTSAPVALKAWSGSAWRSGRTWERYPGVGATIAPSCKCHLVE